MNTINLSITQSRLGEHWNRFGERLTLLNERLLRELENCWRDLESIVEAHHSQTETNLTSVESFTNLEAYLDLRTTESNRLLLEPLAQWERRRAHKRAMLAIENYERNLEELVKSLPDTVAVSGKNALEIFGALLPPDTLTRLAKWRKKERPVALRPVVAQELRRLTLKRANVEGEYLEVMARTALQLRRFWELKRNTLDEAAQDTTAEDKDSHQSELVDFAELRQQANETMTRWQETLQQELPLIARRILRNTLWRESGKAKASDRKRRLQVAHWNDQRRGVEAELRLEQSLVQSEKQLLISGQQSLRSLSQERAALLNELDQFIAWLQQMLQNNFSEGNPPEAQTSVVPAVSRLAEFEANVRNALQPMPELVQITTRLTTLPRPWVKPKTIRPATAFADAFERKGKTPMNEILRGVEADHHRLVREIEQAREVVAFGLSTDEKEAKSNQQIAGEALRNALSLLEFQRQETPSELAQADLRLTQTMAGIFEDNRTVLRRNRIGVFAYLGQQGLQKAFAIGSRTAYEATKRGVVWAYTRLYEVSQNFLVQIGWKQEKETDSTLVVKRPFLPQEFTADLNTKDLPAIYRRLFRFAAVEDPRFLVGREIEMNAIAEARAMWEAGRPVAVLIIGERGSGKTSLINCAMKRPLAGLEIVRGEFNIRFSDAAQLRESLAKLLGIDDSSQLEATLKAKPRVVILEELERSFLRQIGHYAAMRELQRIIAATCRTSLWIVVTNQIAFRFLDAAVSLGQTFSHRINAASASRDALRDAILLRHNLSGLRPQFSLPPTRRTLLNRLRNRLSGQADAEQIFFDQLAKESAGIFRTAFEIWLGQINDVQAGVMSLNSLTTPDLSPVINALDLNDLFTLVAVLQHGSLTPEEHAIIFQKSIPSSRALIDGLLARDIIEPDPGRPGYRVRPEALRVVKEALYRRNLL